MSGWFALPTPLATSTRLGRGSVASAFAMHCKHFRSVGAQESSVGGWGCLLWGGRPHRLCLGVCLGVSPMSPPPPPPPMSPLCLVASLVVPPMGRPCLPHVGRVSHAWKQRCWRWRSDKCGEFERTGSHTCATTRPTHPNACKCVPKGHQLMALGLSARFSCLVPHLRWRGCTHEGVWHWCMATDPSQPP